MYVRHEDLQEAEEEGTDSGVAERAGLGDPDSSAGGVAPAFQACQQGLARTHIRPFLHSVAPPAIRLQMGGEAILAHHPALSRPSHQR